MAKSVSKGLELEKPWDHLEFNGSHHQQEAQRQSARNKYSTEKGFEYTRNLRRQLATTAKRSRENTSISSIRFLSCTRTLRHSRRGAKNWRKCHASPRHMKHLRNALVTHLLLQPPVERNLKFGLRSTQTTALG